MSNTVEVYVADHKHIDFAIPDYCKKVQCNAELVGQWEGYLHDNDNPNDNISIKNNQYSELTALYSMWKNCTADIQGLFHYRRYITHKTRKLPNIFVNACNVTKFVISEQEIISELADTDIILTVPINKDVHKHYLTEMEGFMLCFPRADMVELCRFIEEEYPEYAPSLWHVLRAKPLSTCNMFIARREFVNEYCTWLFGLLFRFEERLFAIRNGTSYTIPRVPGCMAEFLLNVYVHKHNLRCKFFQKAFVADITGKYNVILVAKYAIKQLPFMPAVLRVKNMFSNKLTNRLRILEHCHSHESLKKCMCFFGATRIGEFLCLTVEYSDAPRTVMMLLPIDETTDYLPALMQTVEAQDADAVRKGMMISYRLVVSTKLPDSVKDNLEHAGIRVIEYC